MPRIVPSDVRYCRHHGLQLFVLVNVVQAERATISDYRCVACLKEGEK